MPAVCSIVAGGAGFVVVWVLHKIGKALTAILEALATLAMLFLALWLVAKAGYWVAKTAVTHWRTTLTLVVAAAWLYRWGWPSLTITVGTVAAAVAVWRHRTSFDPWVGRRLRSWWQRWTVYTPRLAKWLRACRLTIRDQDRPMVVSVNPLGRSKLRRQAKPRADQIPKALGVRSGPSRAIRPRQWPDRVVDL